MKENLSKFGFGEIGEELANWEKKKEKWICFILT